ncbi:MAG: redoxin domain-containing protein [Alphaproteobacteria bacterium]|nr:redoxin domain-containing protein [Alphaproteobacteria bacterium]
MNGTILAGSGLVAMLAGATHYLTRVARGDLRAPPPTLLAAVPAGAVLAVAGLALGLSRGESSAALLPPVVLTLLAAGVATAIHLQRRTPQGTLRVAVGDALPSFRATTSDGDAFDARSLRGRRVLLKFYRGAWCPFCQAELKRFDAMRDVLRRHGVEVIALSKDAPEAARRHRARDGLRFPLLCDPDLTVIRQFGVEHHKALEISDGPRLRVFGLAMGLVPSFRAMAIPTTLLVDEHGVIRWVDQSEDYKVRASADRVLTAVADAFGDARQQLDADAHDDVADAVCCPTC